MTQDAIIEEQNWVMIPISGSVLTLPDNAQRNWLMLLTGIASIAFVNTTGLWTCENFNIYPNWQAAVDYAKQLSKLPSSYKVVFQVQQWAPFITINSAYDLSGNAFSVDHWDILFSPDLGGYGHNIFKGITFRAVRIAKADVYRVGFQITLFGSLGGFASI